MKFVFLIVAVVATVLCEKSRYDNYRVYKIEIKNREQLDAMKYLADTSDSFNFWTQPLHFGSYELMVPPHKFSHFSEMVDNLNMQHELIIKNLQELHDKELPLNKRKADGVMDWEDYQSVETIHSWMDSLQVEFPTFVNVTTIGNSYEGRPMKLLKLSKKAGNRAIFVESHIHAREWIGSATSTWILNQLLRSNVSAVVDLANNIDWYFLPIANPDGYEYTRTNNRNWRKTRSKQSALCYGVDPNRNFGYNWMVPEEITGSTGSSVSPCSDVYSGPYNFSEPECYAIDRFLDAHRGIFDAYLALHSYDHSILYPYGNSRVPVPNDEVLKAVGDESARRLYEKHGIQYRVGNQVFILYEASGNSQDHAYGKYKIPISYTYEMRGSGSYGNFGFFLPPEFIIPNAEEMLEAFLGLVSKAREYGLLATA
ncbi:hypothetical protein PVAND_004974 [Polypedilum vanderplanki]|uniref:Zinc carboxypeptidase A 1 n=1 Tax=Polypedilum vanderplanki TaxID=319348 RepID=A0A9J6BZP2_POLVA|nr:hypothetical protein PVAND_004974 [Polypedilum vanderplanki]